MMKETRAEYDADSRRVLEVVTQWVADNPGLALVFRYDEKVALIGPLRHIASVVCECDDSKRLCAHVVQAVPHATWMMLRVALETTLVHSANEADA